MKIKEKDFVEIEYNGKISDSGQVFDTTDDKIAKKEEIYNEKMDYGPVIVCIGEKHLLPGLDKQVIGKETGKEYTIKIPAENGFGRKSAKLLKLVPAKVFKQQQIQPMPGLEINVDGQPGIIRTVSGGRIIVDFNHPLASKDLEYKIKLNKIIKDTKKKLESLLKLELNIQDIKVEVKEGKATIKKDFPKELQDNIKKRIKDLIPEIKGIEFKK
jgi:FKBP-type peptidyl-prolyl cis-trans isomerase 2